MKWLALGVSFPYSIAKHQGKVKTKKYLLGCECLDVLLVYPFCVLFCQIDLFDFVHILTIVLPLIVKDSKCTYNYMQSDKLRWRLNQLHYCFNFGQSDFNWTANMQSESLLVIVLLLLFLLSIIFTLIMI
jgi:hypothetical protein